MRKNFNSGIINNSPKLEQPKCPSIVECLNKL